MSQPFVEPCDPGIIGAEGIVRAIGSRRFALQCPPSGPSLNGAAGQSRANSPPSSPCSQGEKISLAEEAEPPGVGPPEITCIRPATTAAPKPWRADGILA